MTDESLQRTVADGDGLEQFGLWQFLDALGGIFGGCLQEKEEMVYITSQSELNLCQVIFVTAQSMTKIVDGGEFDGAKAYKDSEKSGREYERVVKYVQSILDDELKQ